MEITKTCREGYNIVTDSQTTYVSMCTKGQARFLNLRHKHQSRDHFEHGFLMISGRGRSQKNRILRFFKNSYKNCVLSKSKIFFAEPHWVKCRIRLGKKEFWVYGHFKLTSNYWLFKTSLNWTFLKRVFQYTASFCTEQAAKSVWEVYAQQKAEVETPSAFVYFMSACFGTTKTDFSEMK